MNPTSVAVFVFFNWLCFAIHFFFQWSTLKAKPCIFLNCHSHIHCFLLQIVIVPPVTHFLPASHPHTHLHTRISAHTRAHKNKSLKYTHHRGREHNQCETQSCSHMLAHPHTHTSRKCVTYTHNRGQKHKQSVYLFI